MIRLYAISLLCFVVSGAVAQDNPFECFVTVNGNLYAPRAGSDKGVYPILWYDKTTDPKVLIGGLGVGLSVFRSVAEKVSLKGQANLSKTTYWDEPMPMTGSNNEPLGDFQYGSSDIALGLSGTVHYFLSRRMSVGTGIGARFFTMTLSRMPRFENMKLVSDRVSVNRFNKTILPVLPVEWSLKYEKMLYNIRYEHGLSNRYKRDLAKYKDDRFGVLYFEVGFRLR